MIFYRYIFFIKAVSYDLFFGNTQEFIFDTPDKWLKKFTLNWNSLDCYRTLNFSLKYLKAQTFKVFELPARLPFSFYVTCSFAISFVTNYIIDWASFVRRFKVKQKIKLKILDEKKNQDCNIKTKRKNIKKFTNFYTHTWNKHNEFTWNFVCFL